MSPSSAESKRLSGNFRAPGYDAPAGDGFVARLERAVAPYAHRFSEAPAVLALRESLPIALISVAVAIAVMLAVQPFSGWAALAKELREAIGPAFSIASFVMLVVLALRLAGRLGYAPAPLLLCALLTFWLMLPRDALGALARFVATRGASGWGAFASTLGASGLFTAIVVCLAAAGAVALARRRFGAAGELAGGLGLVGIALLLFALRFSLAGAIAVLVAPLATLGDSFAALVVLTAVEALLWLVGIHGPALLAALVVPVYLHLQLQNTDAFAHRLPLPHTVVVSTFLFVFPGGAGATLPLVALLLRSRVRRLRRFAYATIVPSLINVNEPVIFGLPLAYNPVLAVPFVLVPVVLASVTYAALALGWVARPAFYVPSTVPVLLNALLATLDWHAGVLVALNLVVGGAIWLPFVRVFERAEAARTART